MKRNSRCWKFRQNGELEVVKLIQFLAPLGIALSMQAAIAQQEPTAVRAWFTQADITNSVQMPKPTDALPEASGSAGMGVLLTKQAAIEDQLLNQKTGLISFWIKPSWNGNDGKTHKLLRIGDHRTNGLLVEKSAQGMLRYVMASPKKVTVARADVSRWKAGEWHQVAVAWFGLNGKPIGLPLWIDKTAVDGPIAGGNAFLNPDTMTDKRVFIGDASSDAVMDELIFRNRFDTEDPKGQLVQVYRDYFRTAPYTKIAIDPAPCYATSDPRAIAGFQKQFGLQAMFGKKMVPVTDFTVRYGNWGDFDAKPMIKWSTSSEKIATVDKNGRVTGKSVGKCNITAVFRGMKSTYNLEVTSVEQPDLDLAWVERLPRYKQDAAKDRPDVGEKVESVANIFNLGYKPVPEGTVVRFELIPDTNGNLDPDPSEKPIIVQEQVIGKALAPNERTTVSFAWTWPKNPVFVRVTIDPDNKIAEFCKANNQRCDLNIAHAIRFGSVKKSYDEAYDQKQINLVGSFSRYDWMQAELSRFNQIMRDSAYPDITPNGVQVRFRTDNFIPMNLGNWDDEPYVIQEKDYDGGFPDKETVDLMSIDSGYLHEFGHTMAMLPDLYGYPVHYWGVLLKDQKGDYYAKNDLLPVIRENDPVLPYSSANDVPCGVSYVSLMNSCHLWLHPSNAGKTNYCKDFRGDQFWGIQGRLIPLRESFLHVLDANDQPLKGSAVYVYQCIQTNAKDASTKYFPDRAKFMGNVDKDGWWKIPADTEPTWDDPDTDEVEGQVPVWNPFTRVKSTNAFPDTAFTPNVWCVEGLLLIKVVSGDQTEFHWLSLTDFNEAFFRGEKFRGLYTIRTSLQPSSGITPLDKPTIPDAISKINKKPVAIAPETITVKCGQEFTIDGSKSSDPEGQPLIYRWHLRTREVTPAFSDGAIYKGKAGNTPGNYDCCFYVVDGLRVSEPVMITVKVVK